MIISLKFLSNFLLKGLNKLEKWFPNYVELQDEHEEQHLSFMSLDYCNLLFFNSDFLLDYNNHFFAHLYGFKYSFITQIISTQLYS